MSEERVSGNDEEWAKARKWPNVPPETKMKEKRAVTRSAEQPRLRAGPTPGDFEWTRNLACGCKYNIETREMYERCELHDVWYGKLLREWMADEHRAERAETKLAAANGALNIQGGQIRELKARVTEFESAFSKKSPLPFFPGKTILTPHEEHFRVRHGCPQCENLVAQTGGWDKEESS